MFIVIGSYFVIIQAMLQLNQRNKEINSDNIMIGNGLMNYDFNAGNGNPAYEGYTEVVDGWCMEHVMGFEVPTFLKKKLIGT